MQSHALRTSISYFLRSRERFEAFLGPIKFLADYANGFVTFLAEIASGGEAPAGAGKKLYQYMSKLSNRLGQINHRAFFLAHKSFEGELEDLWFPAEDEVGPLPEYHARLVADLEEFLQQYDAFISHQTPATALPVLLAAQKLQLQIEATFEVLEAVQEALSPDVQAAPGEDELSLYLPSSMTLRDFVSRVEAMQSLYSVTCQLLELDEQEHPLRVVELESGSIFLKLLGETKVMGLITAFLEKAAEWGFRNLTTEGKLGGVPRQVETVDKLLDLTKKLKDAGIDVAEAEDSIRDATVSLSKNLATLIRGQSAVTVNGRTIKPIEKLDFDEGEEILKVLQFDKASSEDLRLPPPRQDT